MGGGLDMENLSDDLLLESYLEAKRLNLSRDFLQLIKKEIDKRCLTNKIKHKL